jgi:multidrug resistance protein
MNKIKLTILFTVLIDIIGFGIVIPIMPFYVGSFGAKPFTITLLFAVFAFFSFFSGPFLGALSDRIGRRPILIISIVSTAIGWLVFAGARSIAMLFAGRIIDGLAAGNIVTAQGYLVDIAKDDKERTTNLGLIGMIFGIGFILGPMIGGFLGSISHSFPFWFVGGLATLNAISAYSFLPETNKNRDRSRPLRFNPFAPIARALTDKRTISGYVVWFLFTIAIALMQSIMALYLFSVYGYQEFASSLVLSGMGVVIALNQGLVLKRVWLKYFSEHHLGFWALLTAAVSFLLMDSQLLAIFIIGLVVMSFSQSLLRVVLTSLAIAEAEPSRKGETLGVMNSLTSAGMIIGPLIAGAAFTLWRSLPMLISSVLMLAAFVIATLNRRRLPQVVLPEDPATNAML